MASQSPPISTPARDRYMRFLAEYLEIRRGVGNEYLLRKAQSLSIALYTATMEAAPSKTEIKADVISRGWKVKRKGGAWPYKKGEKKNNPQGPLNRMRASVIGRRVKAIFYVASGWLPAIRTTGAKSTGGKIRLVEVKNPRGRATISHNQYGDIVVMLVNSTPGILQVEKRYNIVRTAYNAETKDILVYIRQKEAGGSGKSVGGNGK